MSRHLHNSFHRWWPPYRESRCRGSRWTRNVDTGVATQSAGRLPGRTTPEQEQDWETAEGNEEAAEDYVDDKYVPFSGTSDVHIPEYGMIRFAYSGENDIRVFISRWRGGLFCGPRGDQRRGRRFPFHWSKDALSISKKVFSKIEVNIRLEGSWFTVLRFSS